MRVRCGGARSLLVLLRVLRDELSELSGREEFGDEEGVGRSERSGVVRVR